MCVCVCGNVRETLSLSLSLLLSHKTSGIQMRLIMRSGYAHVRPACVCECVCAPASLCQAALAIRTLVRLVCVARSLKHDQTTADAGRSSDGPPPPTVFASPSPVLSADNAPRHVCRRRNLPASTNDAIFVRHADMQSVILKENSHDLPHK